jgi:hypothetical protein
MTSEKCPNCGAGVASDAPKCEYCGTMLAPAGTYSKWISVKDKLPPRSASDPNRSDMVLKCYFYIGMKRYDSWVMSAYYDFKRKCWENDFFQTRIKDDIFTSHWMPLPAFDSPEWIPVGKAIPIEQGNIEGISIFELVSVRDTEYKNSLIAARLDFEENKWFAQLDALAKMNEPDIGLVEILRWMPLPLAPISE